MRYHPNLPTPSSPHADYMYVLCRLSSLTSSRAYSVRRMDMAEYVKTGSHAANLAHQVRTPGTVEVASVEVKVRRAMGNDNMQLLVQ